MTKQEEAPKEIAITDLTDLQLANYIMSLSQNLSAANAEFAVRFEKEQKEKLEKK